MANMAKTSRRVHTVCAATLLLLTAGSKASAQTSPSPPASQPDYSKEPYVVEQVFTKLIFQNDGKYTQEVTARVRVQSQAGVQANGILHFPFASATSTLEVVYVRVTKQDKSVVETPVENILEMPADITREAPFYSDLKEKQVAVKGLEIGNTLEYRYRGEVSKPLDPGQFWFSYRFIHSGIVLQEELQISVPRDRYVNVKSSEVQPTTNDQDGVRTFDWKTANLQAASSEKTSATAETDSFPSVQLTTFRSWDEVGQWFKSLAVPQAAVTPAIEAKAKELTLSAKTDSQKIHAIYDFVSTRFRYIGISLGIGRYQPHAAADVLSNDYGDCKDKHTLFASLLSAVGIKAYPVLINSAQKIDPDVPSPGQFDHVITALQQENGFLFADTTPEIAPFGLLIAPLRDKQALVIPEKTPAQLVRTPADPPFKGFFHFQADGALDENGTLTSKMQITLRGDDELPYRLVMRQGGQARWKDVMQQISSNMGFGGTVNDVTATSPEATDAPFQIGYAYDRKEYSDWAERRISPPFPAVLLPNVPDDKDKETKPLKLGTPEEVLFAATVKLPPGSAPSVPATVDLHESFADYHAEYSFANGTMHFERRLVTKIPEVPVEQIEAYRKFRKTLADDVNALIALGNEAPSPAPAPAPVATPAATPVVATGSSGSPESRALIVQAESALRRRDLPAAQDAYQRAVDADPQFAAAWYFLGRLHLSMNKEGQGVTEIKKAIELDATVASFYEDVAEQFVARHRDQPALEIWKALETARPQDTDPPVRIAAILMRQEHYSEAVKELEPVVQRKPDDGTILLRLGEAYVRSGDKEKGSAAIVKATGMVHDPSDLNDAADALAESNLHLNDALGYAEESVRQVESTTSKITLSGFTLDDIRAMPALAARWGTLGWVEYRLGHLDLAEKYLNAGWSLTQDSVIADRLGQMYETEGKKHDAAIAYAHALSNGQATPQETEKRLQAVQKGTKYQEEVRPDPIALQDLRTMKLPRMASGDASAEFFILFAAGPKVVDVKFVSGSEQLRDATKVLAAAHFNVPFPDGSPAQILRRGLLSCEPKVPQCLFVFIPPNAVDSVK
jgi:tetratricopeptide (TPR) repeat protein/transglutaminase-like putative cysteine protease